MTERFFAILLQHLGNRFLNMNNRWLDFFVNAQLRLVHLREVCEYRLLSGSKPVAVYLRPISDSIAERPSNIQVAILQICSYRKQQLLCRETSKNSQCMPARSHLSEHLPTVVANDPGGFRREQLAVPLGTLGRNRWADSHTFWQAKT